MQFPVQLWPFFLGVAYLALALIERYTPESEVRGLEELHFPVVFRDDEGYFHLMEDGSQFLTLFELQDLTEEQFQGWDARGCSFRFVSQGYTNVFADIAGPQIGTLREKLNGFFAHASDSPGLLSPESHQKLRTWLDSLPRGL